LKSARGPRVGQQCNCCSILLEILYIRSAQHFWAKDRSILFSVH